MALETEYASLLAALRHQCASQSLVCTAAGAAVLFSGCSLLMRRSPVRTRTQQRIFMGRSDLNNYVAKAFQPTLDKYTPVWWTNAHIQVALTFFVQQQNVRYQRDIVELKDGGRASLDWALESASRKASTLKDDAPIALIIHGLTGCSRSMRGLCAEALEHGYRPVVFNKRGHGGVKLTTPKLQAFGCIQDLQQAISQVEHSYPRSKLYGIGFSAGSGLLCSYFGETGNDSRLRAGVLVSPGYNSDDLLRGKGVHPVYDFLMSLKLRKFLLRHREELKSVVDLPSALKARSIGEFDERVYMKIHGYDSLESYWAHNNPLRKIQNIQRPMLLLNALDDPVYVRDKISYEPFTGNSSTMLVETGEGSHCAFYQGKGLDLHCWAHEAALVYLDSVREYEETHQTS